MCGLGAELQTLVLLHAAVLAAPMAVPLCPLWGLGLTLLPAKLTGARGSQPGWAAESIPCGLAINFTGLGPVQVEHPVNSRHWDPNASAHPRIITTAPTLAMGHPEGMSLGGCNHGIAIAGSSPALIQTGTELKSIILSALRIAFKTKQLSILQASAPHHCPALQQCPVISA